MSEVDSTSSNARTRKWLLKAIASGYCTRCGKVPPVAGLKQCQPCRERTNALALISRQKNRAKINDFNKRRRQAWIDRGVCPRCGRQPEPGRTACPRCLEIERAKKRAAVAADSCTSCGAKNCGLGPSKWECPPCYQMSRQRETVRRDRRKATGTCLKCTSPSRLGKAMCLPCFERDRAGRIRRQKLRLAAGLCKYCGNHPHVTGNSSCTNCILYMRCTAHFGAPDPDKIAGLAALFEQQGGRCAYTNRRIVIGVDAEIDHIHPRARGGATTLQNLQWVWSVVNQMKSDLPADEFLRLARQMAKLSDASV